MAKHVDRPKASYDYVLTYVPANLGMSWLQFEALTDEQKAVAFGQPWGKVTSDLSKALDTLDGGGWEAVSHDLLIFGNTLIVSFLTRRRKQ